MNLKGFSKILKKEFKDKISLPHFLIKQAEIKYNLIMLEKAQEFDDEATAYYFEQRAKQMQKFGSIDILFNQHFAMDLPKGSFDEMPELFYSWCEKYILEIMPGIKELFADKIRLKKDIVVSPIFEENHDDIPF